MTIKDLRKLLQRERAKMRQYHYRLTNKLRNLQSKYAVLPIMHPHPTHTTPMACTMKQS